MLALSTYASVLVQLDSRAQVLLRLYGSIKALLRRYQGSNKALSRLIKALLRRYCAPAVRVQLDSRPEVIDRLERKRLQLEIELRQITKEQGGRYLGLLELFRGALTADTVHAAPLLRR